MIRYNRFELDIAKKQQATWNGNVVGCSQNSGVQ